MTLRRLLPSPFALLFLLASACGGSGGDTVVLGSPELPREVPAPLTKGEVDLAQCLAGAQLSSGGYDWRQDAYLPWDLTVAGYQNVTGISVLGLVDAYDADMRDNGRLDYVPFVPVTLSRTAAYLVQVMADFNADVGEDRISLPNFMFLAAYRERFPLDAADWQTVEAAFQKMLATRDASHGTDASVQADGWWNAIVDRRASLPGLVGWDLGFLWMGLVAMDAPQAEIDWVGSALLDLGTELRMLDPATDYLALSFAQLTRIYAAMESTEPVVGDVLDALLAYDDGAGFYLDYQTTAYACMALAQVGRVEEYLRSADLLRMQIDALGRIIESDGFVYFEIQGEVLQALLGQE